MSPQSTPPAISPVSALNEREILLTLFDLGRQVASVIDINELLPQIVTLQVYKSLLENAVGEHTARMTAMDSATKNTKELIGSLTLKMNRARQAAITKELIEIVSGAEALKG